MRCARVGWWFLRVSLVAALALGCDGADDDVGDDDAGDDDTGDDDVGDDDTGDDDAGDDDTGDDDAGDDDSGDDDSGDDDAGDDDSGVPDALPLLAVASCNPGGDPCALGAADPTTYVSYRKDAYLPDADYDEYTDPPLDGGRFHVAAIAAVDGTVTGVQLDGADVDTLLVEPTMEWYHVWPTTLTAGEPVWFAFHSRDAAWDQPGASATLTITTDQGTAVDTAITPSQTEVPLTYVTVSDDAATTLVHLRNDGAAPHTLTGLLVDGRDVLAADVACAPLTTLTPGQVLLITVPRCAAAAPGEAWTVVATFAATAPAVGVGRVLRPHFPIEAWPSGGDCPFPTVDAAHHQAHADAGFDTYYAYWGGSCDASGAEIVNQIGPTVPGFHVLIGDDFLDHGDPATAITDDTAVAGFLTGDESDGEIYPDGIPHASTKAADARELWSYYPQLTVYNGAKTNGHVGSFAGMTDVQGIDFYAAACAPHITAWGTHPPLRGPYDYLRNTRENHMPLPTWMYAQGLSQVWNKESLLGTEIVIQPDPQEILVQALSVMAAGGKGLMWFQTSMEEADREPARWDAIGDANRLFRGVRRLLREGDLAGLATSPAASSGDALVAAVRARGAVVVPVIDLVSTAAPTDVTCAAAQIGLGAVPHWELGALTTDVVVAIPDDLTVADVFEVTPAGVVDVASPVVDGAGRTITIPGVALDNTAPARVYVLATDPLLRDEVAAEMAY